MLLHRQTEEPRQTKGDNLRDLANDQVSTSDMYFAMAPAHDCCPDIHTFWQLVLLTSAQQLMGLSTTNTIKLPQVQSVPVVTAALVYAGTTLVSPMAK